jgi:hypothetical protein
MGIYMTESAIRSIEHFQGLREHHVFIFVTGLPATDGEQIGIAWPMSLLQRYLDIMVFKWHEIDYSYAILPTQVVHTVKHGLIDVDIELFVVQIRVCLNQFPRQALHLVGHKVDLISMKDVTYGTHKVLLPTAILLIVDVGPPIQIAVAKHYGLVVLVVF